MAYSDQIINEAIGKFKELGSVTAARDYIIRKYPMLKLHPNTVAGWVKKEPAPTGSTQTAALIHTPKLPSSGNVVLVIPDLHCPFHHPDALAFLLEVQRRIQPDEIVNLGDEVDFHAFSRWPKDPDGMAAGAELRAAIEALIPFYVAFPNVRVCVSNHTIRPRKLMKDIQIPAALWPAYETMLNAPDGWSWHEHIIIDGVRYMHGDQGKGGALGWVKNSEVYHQSVVVGHWHSKAGVFYDSDMFNVNAGCLIDPTSYAFDYARHSHKKANLGCAVVTHGRKATFLPMLLDSNGRWVGHL